MKLKHNTRPTSVAAAIANLPVRAKQWRAIMVYMKSRKSGATRDEVEAATSMLHQSCGPRIKELLEAGLLRETTRLRKTRSGREAYVLELKSNNSKPSR